MKSMRRAGRFNPIVLIGLVSAIAIIVALFFAKDVPTSATNEFLVAMAKRDVKKVTELSAYEGSRAELEKQWDYCLNVASLHYRWIYKIRSYRETAPGQAAVAIGFTKNAFDESSYEENFDIPMKKVDGKWKVDVRSMSREMFPALPR